MENSSEMYTYLMQVCGEENILTNQRIISKNRVTDNYRDLWLYFHWIYSGLISKRENHYYDCLSEPEYSNIQDVSGCLNQYLSAIEDLPSMERKSSPLKIVLSGGDLESSEARIKTVRKFEKGLRLFVKYLVLLNKQQSISDTELRNTLRKSLLFAIGTIIDTAKEENLKEYDSVDPDELAKQIMKSSYLSPSTLTEISYALFPPQSPEDNRYLRARSGAEERIALYRLSKKYGLKLKALVQQYIDSTEEYRDSKTTTIIEEYRQIKESPEIRTQLCAYQDILDTFAVSLLCVKAHKTDSKSVSILLDAFYYRLIHPRDASVYNLQGRNEQAVQLLEYARNISENRFSKTVSDKKEKSRTFAFISPVSVHIFYQTKGNHVAYLDKHMDDYVEFDLPQNEEDKSIFYFTGNNFQFGFNCTKLGKDKTVFDLNDYLSIDQIRASYDRTDALNYLNQNNIKFCFEQLEYTGTKEDIALLTKKLPDFHKQSFYFTELAKGLNCLIRLSMKYDDISAADTIFELEKSHGSNSIYKTVCQDDLTKYHEFYNTKKKKVTINMLVISPVNVQIFINDDKTPAFDINLFQYGITNYQKQVSIYEKEKNTFTLKMNNKTSSFTYEYASQDLIWNLNEYLSKDEIRNAYDLEQARKNMNTSYGLTILEEIGEADDVKAIWENASWKTNMVIRFHAFKAICSIALRTEDKDAKDFVDSIWEKDIKDINQLTLYEINRDYRKALSAKADNHYLETMDELKKAEADFTEMLEDETKRPYVYEFLKKLYQSRLQDAEAAEQVDTFEKVYSSNYLKEIHQEYMKKLGIYDEVMQHIKQFKEDEDNKSQKESGV